MWFNSLWQRMNTGLLLLCCCSVLLTACSESIFDGGRKKVGVVYIIHGGYTTDSQAGLWEATVQIFGYDPNSMVYQRVIWNEDMWPRILQFGNAPKEQGKYAFEYARIGGTDPATSYTDARLTQLRRALKNREDQLGVSFVVDYAAWIAADPRHHVNPRMLYNPGVKDGVPLTYCGSAKDGGTGKNNTWPGCDPERYNTDGTIERMLKAGVDEIVMIDMTTSGVRFFKTYDVISNARALVASYNEINGTDIQVQWVNDPADLMRDSYPDRPAGWTRSLGRPINDPSVPLADAPNPVAYDPRLAAFHTQGISRQIPQGIPEDQLGVLLVNHATRQNNQLFDPKIDDTLVMNENIKQQLLERYPGIRAENIVGGWMGVKERNKNIKINPRNRSQLERTRAMRGENLGHAYLYETDEQMPGAEWRYRYWEALELLRAQGATHIVIAFPQIMVDSVLNLVELPNQIGTELGYRTWLYADQLDFETYPEIGHPFADYWGIWVEELCRYPDEPDMTQSCCFEMGGCEGRAYPPPRQTPIDKPRDDMDPSLAWDVSAYGHLGYDPARGAPRNDRPVQAQYRGTWAIWNPPNDDPAVADFLADHVVQFIESRQ